MNGRRCGAAAVLCLVLFYSGVADAQSAELDVRSLLRAQVCYEQLDYDCVVDEMGGALSPFLQGREPQAAQLPALVQASELYALALLALGRDSDARDVFEWVLTARPDYRLQGTDVPPEFRVVFASVLSKRRAASLARDVQPRLLARYRATAVTRQARRLGALIEDTSLLPAEGIDVELSLAALWQGFSGDDAENFSPGFRTRVELALKTPEGLADVWVAVGFGSHKVLISDLQFPSQSSFEILRLHGGLGYRLPIMDMLQLRGKAGLGYSAFGAGQLSRSAFDLYSAGELQVRAGGFFVGVEAGIGSAFTLCNDADVLGESTEGCNGGGVASSIYRLFGARLGGTFR